jgi:hypothetical protein
MKTRAVSNFLWGAQAASLQFAAACREHPTTPFADPDRKRLQRDVRPASCRAMQAGSLRSPDTMEIPTF